MGAAAVPLVATSTIYGVGAAQKEGEAAERIANVKAKMAMATGSRQAIEERRRGDIVQSNARAAMAAGGGVTTDAAAIETLAKIEDETQYNSLTAMYEGKVQRDYALYEGGMAKARAKSKALQTVLSGASSATFMGYNPAGGGGAVGDIGRNVGGGGTPGFLQPVSSGIKLGL